MTYAEFKQKFNITLNEQQEKAVKEVDGAFLVLAVPGSGKTTVLITRLGYMVFGLGIPAENILTVTYTVSATKEMNERFVDLFSAPDGSVPDFKTINGMSQSIILNYERQTGGKAFTLVTDEKKLNEIIMNCYRRHSTVYPTEADIKNVKTLITYAKNMMLEKGEIEGLNGDGLPFSKIYNDYCEELKSRRLMDFDDQMVYAYQILTTKPDVLEYYTKKYKYVCVDEAQDTSKIQHKIIELLAKKSGNIFMVGDEDQSIYGFRAAYPDALINFKSVYENAKVTYLEKNYRSTANIVNAAKNFIATNKYRYEKNMSAVRDFGEDIKQILIPSRAGQYTYLLSVARENQGETAVLYRDNENVLPLVDVLDRKGVDYNIKNAELTFFTNRVVTDVVNIIKFAYNPKDTELFRQIYYRITTYLPKQKIDLICRTAKKHNVNVLDAVTSFIDVKGSINTSCSFVRSWLKEITKVSAEKAVTIIKTELGYEKFLSRAGMNSKSLDIIKELSKHENSAIGLINRLNYLSNLLKDKPYIKNCNFLLSTIHSSKGLEYENVYLLDVFDGVFPDKVIVSKGNDKLLKAYEEERRLFYVGITRAKNTLNIFRFGAPTSFYTQMLGAIPLKVGGSVQKKQVRTVVNGQRVDHVKYGKGTLISQDEQLIEITFDSGATKKFVKDILEKEDKLKILE